MTSPVIPTPDEVSALQHRSEVDAAVHAGLRIGRLNSLRDDQRYAFTLVPKDCNLQVIDREELEAKLAEHPRRKTGTVHVHSADSFVAYLDKHALDCTEVWADRARRALTGVVNAHAGVIEVANPNAPKDEDGAPLDDLSCEDLAGHGDHRVKLELIRTPNWEAWLKHDKKLLDQATFAEHLEDNAIDIIEPDSATMLEIAQHFQATVGADFKSADRLHDGQVQFRYEETVNARAGESGDIDIPTEFTLGVVPFVGGAVVQVSVRFRYRVRQGNIALSYAIRNPHDIEEAAFNHIVEFVRDEADEPVYLGRPE